MALLKLGDKYSVARLEAACKKALFYTFTPSLDFACIFAMGCSNSSYSPFLANQYSPYMSLLPRVVFLQIYSFY
jgi:hypothetical protein